MFLFALFVFLPLDILYCSYNYISTGKKIIIVYWVTAIVPNVFVYWLIFWGSHGIDHMVQLPVLITTKVVSSNPVHGKVYSIQHGIKFVSDLRQVGGFLRVLWFPPPIKLTHTI